MTRSPSVLPVSCAGHALTHIYLMICPAVLVWIEAEFAADNARMGAINTVGFFFGLAALPTGWLVARWGAPWVLAAGFVGACLACAAVGLTSSLVGFTLCLLLLNVALGVYHPAANTLISHHAARRGRALGIHGTFGSLGEFLGPIAGVLLAVWLFSWRGAFVAMAVPGAAVAIWYACLARRLPADPPEHHDDRHHGAFFNPALLLVFLVLVLNGFMYRAITLFLPKFLHEHGPQYAWLAAGKSMGLQGGLFAGLVLGLGGVGQWVSGHLTDRFNRPLLLAAVFGLTAATLGSMALTAGVALFAFGLVFGFVYFMLQPVTNGLVARYSRPDLRGWAYALAFFAQFGPGALGLPLAGRIADAWGLHAVFAACAAWSLATAVVALVLYRVCARYDRSRP